MMQHQISMNENTKVVMACFMVKVNANLNLSNYSYFNPLIHFIS